MPNKPLTNAERQARRKRSGPRPIMSVTVSRWVQAAVDAWATALGVSASDAWERLAESSMRREGREGPFPLTDRGASILGCCTACKRELCAGDRVRREGEFARHEGCQAPPK